MQQSIYRSAYKDIRGITLENECLKAVFFPEYGGKLASLVYKKTSREFLMQAMGTKYKVLRYGESYVNAECSGFDDMFPTIDRMYYDRDPWRGVEVPDHGEVCSLPWDYDIQEDCLYMSVHGVRFPYRLEKWIYLHPGKGLRIEYKATSLSSFDLDFLWAAHPIIDGGDGGEIIIPFDGNQKAICVFSSDNEVIRCGDMLSWPETVLRNGSRMNLARLEKQGERKAALKYYFTERLQEGWCAYRCKADGTALKMLFPEDVVPYLGILTGEDPLTGRLQVFLEPCTGAYDRPDLARLHGQNSVLSAGEAYSWHLELTVLDESTPLSISGKPGGLMGA